MFSSVLLPASILNTHILQNFSSYLLTSYYLLTSHPNQHFKYAYPPKLSSYLFTSHYLLTSQASQHFKYRQILQNFSKTFASILNTGISSETFSSYLLTFPITTRSQYLAILNMGENYHISTALSAINLLCELQRRLVSQTVSALMLLKFW